MWHADSDATNSSSGSTAAASEYGSGTTCGDEGTLGVDAGAVVEISAAPPGVAMDAQTESVADPAADPATEGEVLR